MISLQSVGYMQLNHSCINVPSFACSVPKTQGMMGWLEVKPGQIQWPRVIVQVSGRDRNV
jgi:hypothetical protein